MNNNAFLEKLLQGTKVEWKTLGEVCEIADNARKPVKASLRISGNIPYYGANNIQDYVEGYTHNGEYVLIAEDGSASLENYSIQWASGKFWANNHVHVIRGYEEINNRFLYHYLRQMNFIPYLTGGDRAKLTKAKMLQILLPIPPLSVQQEIVKTLDTLTALNNELINELAKELTLRQKQYQYYRDMLLNFKELNGGGYEVKWKTLGEVCDLQAGKHIPASKISPSVDGEHIYPCYGGNGVRGYVQDFSHNGNYIFIGRQGALCGNVQRYTGKLYATEHAVVVSCSNVIHPDYMFHLLTVMDLNQYASKSAQPGLVVGKLKDLKIPIPSIEEQYRIVEILDKFDTLTNSISEGLPKEIELRNKQYEYYREMLLGFERV